MTEWLAYARLEPFGEERADFRAGQVCATVANFAGKALREGAEPLAPADFMPALAEQRQAAQQPIRLDDPEAHARLIKQQIFGVKDV